MDRNYWESLPEKQRIGGRAALIAGYSGYPLVGRSAAFINGLPLPLTLKNIPVELGCKTRQGSRGDTNIVHRFTNSKLPGHFRTGTIGTKDFTFTDITRTCIDVARWYPLTEAVTYIDHALRHRLSTREQFGDHLAEMQTCRETRESRVPTPS